MECATCGYEPESGTHQTVEACNAALRHIGSTNTECPFPHEHHAYVVSPDTITVTKEQLEALLYANTEYDTYERDSLDVSSTVAGMWAQAKVEGR